MNGILLVASRGNAHSHSYCEEHHKEVRLTWMAFLTLLSCSNGSQILHSYLRGVLEFAVEHNDREIDSYLYDLFLIPIRRLFGGTVPACASFAPNTSW